MAKYIISDKRRTYDCNARNYIILHLLILRHTVKCSLNTTYRYKLIKSLSRREGFIKNAINQS